MNDQPTGDSFINAQTQLLRNYKKNVAIYCYFGRLRQIKDGIAHKQELTLQGHHGVFQVDPSPKAHGVRSFAFNFFTQ